MSKKYKIDINERKIKYNVVKLKISGIYLLDRKLINKSLRKKSIKKHFFKVTKKMLKNRWQYSKFIILYQGQCLTGCSAVGSARGLGPWGREFESLHPDQNFLGL